MLDPVYLSGGTRTPIGSFGGALVDVSAPALGSTAIRACLARAGVTADRVDQVILGNVLSAGLGQNVARQAAIGSGIPVSTGALTVNRVCGSGLAAVILASQALQCGDAQLVVAGGTENMSQAPYLLPKARYGYRMGHGEIIDSMVRDGLWDVYNDLHMGSCGDRCAERCGFSRQAQDDFAVASYQRAREAQRRGWFADEITTVEVSGRKGATVVEQDEEPGRFQEDKLRGLKPAFHREGSVTAGNASSINDGAAAIVVCSESAVAGGGIRPDVRIVGYAAFSREPEWFTLAPIGAIQKLLDTIGWQIAEVDLFEVNEAFAVVPMAVMKDLEVPHEKMNVHGGAVALGHPIGASGARTLVTLIAALRQHGLKRGIVALCIGGGEAVAMAVERC